MRIIQKLLFIACLLLSFSSLSSADNFYPTAETLNCEMIGVAGITYTENLNNEVSYDKSQVVGERLNWITTHKFSDIALYQYPNSHRLNNKADFVAVPPNTDVTFGVWFYNYSGHDIKVHNIQLFTSRTNYDNGDLTKLGAVGSPLRSNFLFGNILLERLSKAYSTGWGYTYKNGVDNYGQQVYTFKTVQPIKVLSFTQDIEFINGSVVAKYSLKLKNSSKYDLCNIDITNKLVSGNQYSSTVCLNSMEEKILEYEDVLPSNIEGEVINEGVVVTDNNTHVESINSVQSWLHDRTFETIPFVFGRSDSTNTNWSGYQPGWGEEGRSISVKLLPYSIKSNQLSTNIPIELNIATVLKDGKGNEVDQSSDIEIGFPEKLLLDYEIENIGGYIETVRVENVYDENYLLSNTPISELHFVNNTQVFSPNFEFSLSNEIPQGTFNTEITTNVYVNNQIYTTKTVNLKIVSYTQLELKAQILNYDNTLSHSKEIVGGYSDIGNRTNNYVTFITNFGNAKSKNLQIKQTITDLLLHGIITTISDSGTINTDQSSIIWEIYELDAFSSKELTFNFEYPVGKTFEGELKTTASTDFNQESLTDANTTIVVAPVIDVTFEKQELVLKESEKSTISFLVTNSGKRNGDDLEFLFQTDQNITFKILEDVTIPFSIEDQNSYTFTLEVFDGSESYYINTPFNIKVMQNGHELAQDNIYITHKKETIETDNNDKNENKNGDENVDSPNQAGSELENSHTTNTVTNNSNNLISQTSRPSLYDGTKFVPKKEMEDGKDVLSVKDNVKNENVENSVQATLNHYCSLNYLLLILVALLLLTVIYLWLKKESYCSIRNE